MLAVLAAAATARPPGLNPALGLAARGPLELWQCNGRRCWKAHGLLGINTTRVNPLELWQCNGPRCWKAHSLLGINTTGPEELPLAPRAAQHPLPLPFRFAGQRLGVCAAREHTALVGGTRGFLYPAAGRRPVMRTLPMTRSLIARGDRSSANIGGMAADPGASMTVERAMLDDGGHGTVVTALGIIIATLIVIISLLTARLWLHDVQQAGPQSGASADTGCDAPTSALGQNIEPVVSITAPKAPNSGTAPGADASAPAGPAATARPPGTARHAPRHRGRRRGGADSAVDGDGGDATASSTCHDACSSSDAPAHAEPAAPEAAIRSPDDEYTQPDGSCMCEAHGPVVQTVGVQDKLLRSLCYLAKSPCTSRSLGDVASSSNGQQAHQQKRSAGRLASRSDSRFLVQDWWKELPARMAHDQMMHKANGGCPSEVIEPPSPCGSEGDPHYFQGIPAGFHQFVNRREDDNTGWEDEIPQPRPWRLGGRTRPPRLALCDSDGDSGAEDDGEGGGSDSGTEDDGGGGSDDGAGGCDDVVDTDPVWTWDDLHWNDPVRPTRSDLPQARVCFKILGVRRNGTVRTNLWTQPLDGEEHARVRLRLFVRANGQVLSSTKAHGWTRMPDEVGRVSAIYVHLRLRTRRSTPESSASVFVTLLADSGYYPDWAKVGASDSAPSERSSLGEADDDLDVDDFDNSD
jgi:hypothetical protein